VPKERYVDWPSSPQANVPVVLPELVVPDVMPDVTVVFQDVDVKVVNVVPVEDVVVAVKVLNA